MKKDFYSNIEKLLLISDYPLYHAYSTILTKDLNLKIQRTLAAKEKENQNLPSSKTLKLTENIDMQKSYNNILLSAMSTPYFNYFTNYLKIGDELFENEKEIELETCNRMMNVLKIPTVPSRKNIIQYVKENKIAENCEKNIQKLFELIEYEKNPLKISKEGSKILENLSQQNIEKIYLEQITKNMTVKILQNLSNLYDNISFSRIKKILNFVEEDDLENIILENSRIGLISCKIDYENDIIIFNINKNLQANLNEKFLNFLNSIEKIGTEIVFNNIKNKKKTSNLRNIVLNELNSFNSTSLTLSDNLLSSINAKTLELNNYIRKKEEIKNELIEQKNRERNEAKEKAERDAKAMKEILKDEQKQKEFDIQLKKFLIDRIKIYTNTVVVDNKKMRLDDLIKDLSKVKDETLIKALEKEEVEFKTKKEKRFKELVRDSDYMLRELRKRDMKKYSEILKQEEIELNRSKEEKAKKEYEQKILLKKNFNEITPFTDKFFGEIEKKRQVEYEEKIELFKKNLFEKIKGEYMKEVGGHFKIYIEEFRKEEEENKKKQALMSNNQSRQNNNLAFGKGQKFMRFDDKPKTATSMEISSKLKIINLKSLRKK